MENGPFEDVFNFLLKMGMSFQPAMLVDQRFGISLGLAPPGCRFHHQESRILNLDFATVTMGDIPTYNKPPWERENVGKTYPSVLDMRYCDMLVFSKNHVCSPTNLRAALFIVFF